MKNPNRYGTVSLIDKKSKRRKPYRVQVFVDYKVNEEKGTATPIRKTIGYARTRAEGNTILANYHGNPYDLDLVDVSFKYLFDLWHDYKKRANISEKTLRLYDQYYKYYKPVHSKPFAKITRLDLQNIVDEINGKPDYKAKVLNLYNQMYRFADNMNIKIEKKASVFVNLPKMDYSIKHIPFNEKEIQLLWDNRNDIIDEILVNIYTGVRPGELLLITEIHNDYFITGSKTEAGKNRVVPLNDKIKNIFHELIDKKSFKKYNTQDNLYHAWKSQFIKLGLEKHSPYDCRHTFATLMSRYKADEHCTKLIMGHRINDLTKRVYTHKIIEDLINEVNKI